jgi:pimeloyl-ACP methyl ester carboxylesterase
MDAAFAAVKAPVLAIQSTTRNDKLQRTALKPGDTSPWLDFLKKFPNVRTEIIPDTGHFTQLEQPERVNQLIREVCR